ncbi:MAG: twin-arginine translocase subunit TatC [Candidatus Gribaldobacteria bacterium]|nr:twin-arginine translocase subunit TatC [Candidatus Gribaldobacteria bacterium]
MDEGIKQKFSEHFQYIDDIRRRAYSLIIFFLIFFVAGFLGANKILELIIKLIKVQNVTIVTTSPFQFLDLAMSVGIFTALILCLPIAIYHLYSFLKDGLSKKERRYFFILLPISFFLFVVGFGYGFAILYFCLDIIAKINLDLGVNNFWDVNQFLSQIISTAALLGLVFQFPIVLTVLIKMKIIDVKFLKDKRRYAIASMFILVSLLPPTDGLSLVVMVVPLIAIYEITILVNLISSRKVLVNSLSGVEKIIN